MGNLKPQPGIFPDCSAPIVRNTQDGAELAKVRWGLPSGQFALMQNAKKRAAKLEGKGHLVDFAEIRRMEPDSGTTKVRNIFDCEKGRGNQHCPCRWQEIWGYVVCVRREQAARILRRPLGSELDECSQGQKGDQDLRSVRLSDLRATTWSDPFT